MVFGRNVDEKSEEAFGEEMELVVSLDLKFSSSEFKKMSKSS